MVNKNYQKHKERLQKEARENGEKRPKKDIKVLLEKKKKRGVSIIRNISGSYLSIEEIIIQNIKSIYWTTSKVTGKSNLFHGLALKMGKK